MIVREALCTYELDVTHELVISDIYSSDGVNMFEKWRLRASVTFDDPLTVAVRNGLDGIQCVDTGALFLRRY